MIAVTADGDSFPKRKHEAAHFWGAGHQAGVVQTNELERFKENPPDRCYIRRAYLRSKGAGG